MNVLRRHGRSLRRLELATLSIVAAGALVVGLASNAVAYTVIGAYFLPDHAPRGATILVGGLPYKQDCPEVNVALAKGVSPDPPIVSRTDPRLHWLDGRTEYRSDLGVKTSYFSFLVPSLALGRYSSYWYCPHGARGFDTFWSGATSFTIEAGSLPPTDVSAPIATTGGRADGVPTITPTVAVSVGAGVLGLFGGCRLSRRCRRLATGDRDCSPNGRAGTRIGGHQS